MVVMYEAQNKSVSIRQYHHALNRSRVRHVLADIESDLPRFKLFEGIHHILNVSVLRDFMVGISKHLPCFKLLEAPTYIRFNKALVMFYK